MKVKNVVFDIGNVLVKWAPLEVISLMFPEYEPKVFYQKMRPIWLDLNLGKFTEQEAIILYRQTFNMSEEKLARFMDELKNNQTPIPGSLELLDRLASLGFNLYSITDNIREFIQYHRLYSSFPQYFKDIVVSAEVGVLKPDKKIYQCLIDKHALDPRESVFIDDIIENVEGALSVGMQGFQFMDVPSCQEKLVKLCEIPI